MPSVRQARERVRVVPMNSRVTTSGVFMAEDGEGERPIIQVHRLALDDVGERSMLEGLDGPFHRHPSFSIVPSKELLLRRLFSAVRTCKFQGVCQPQTPSWIRGMM